MRDVCAEYFQQHPMTIGGPGIKIEINESKFGQRKYNCGRCSKKATGCFGGVERITGRAFMVKVGQRDAATLIPIIQQYIRLVILEMMYIVHMSCNVNDVRLHPPSDPVLSYTLTNGEPTPNSHL